MLRPFGQAAAGGLTFRELEALASTGLAGFLTLTRARVTLHVAFLFERHAEFCVELFKCTGDAEANGAGLSGHAATMHGHVHVERLVVERQFKRIGLLPVDTVVGGLLASGVI